MCAVNHWEKPSEICLPEKCDRDQTDRAKILRGSVVHESESARCDGVPLASGKSPGALRVAERNWTLASNRTPSSIFLLISMCRYF